MPAPHAFRGGATPAGAASIRRSLTPLVTRWKEGARRPLAYCFDRFTAAAFRLDDLTLAWSGGEWPDGPAAQAGDPELLRRIAAARDAHWGLLVMRDDGRGACLSRIDGAPLWQFSLPPSPTYDVDMIDTRASVVWPEGDATRYAWLELGADPPTPRLGQTGKLRAFWSAACSSGLLLASPDRVLLMRGDAPRTIYDGRRAGVYRATLCALKSLAAENERVGFVTQDGFVHSASLAYRESWRRALPDVTPEHLAPLVLQFDGGHVLVGYRQTLAAFSAAGEPVAAVGDWCGLTGSARVRDGILEYVASEPAGESFALVSTPLADQMGSNRRPLEGVRTRPQGVVLTRDHVVIAEDRRLSGFPIR
ncbi:MAG: hypothetical protein CHACPFDD_00158 [Phycisphaerae bacterium]|nr:hypothetical protein [Phycisphaerae bacterium]